MKTLLLTFILIIAFAGCRKKHTDDPTRSFLMAVTPWPADFTMEGLEDSYAFINDHCDMVSHHFDEGIPYEEAYHGLVWPQELLNDVANRKTRTAPGKKIFLSVAPLNLTRHEKADYYRVPDSITDSIKNHWNALPVNDARVITAYVHYISFLIDELDPAYVNYGVESNEISWDAAAFIQYKDFLAQVFMQLKAKYPGLPFFLSFMVSEHPVALSLAHQLLPFTDHIALSAYPYVHVSTTANGNTDPKLFPSDLFTRFTDLAPAKPWGFAETGFIAEDLSIPSFSLQKTGNHVCKKEYLY